MTTELTGGRGRWILAAGLAAVIAGAGGVAVARAQQAPDPAGPCAGRRGMLTSDDREAIGRVLMNRMKDRLGLSEQQAEDIRSTLKARRDDARADWQALCLARVELRQLMDRQDSDPAALKAAGERLKALQAKLQDRRLDTYLALRGKLTPDQWAKWVEFRKERAGHWRGRFRGLAS
jgi:Spy/CpxP family protein refolding chaperone